MISKTELVRDTIQVHGHFAAARLMRKTVPFSLFYWMAFGRQPKQLTQPPVSTITTAAERRVSKILKADAKTHIGRIAA